MVGLVKDLNVGWWIEFERELTVRKVAYKLIDLGKNNWEEEVGECDAVIYRYNFVEPIWSQANSALYFIEFVLKKRVFPDDNLRWHYNNKIGQTYLAKHFDIKMPPSFISYSFEDTLSYLDNCDYPVVSKSAGGAASKNVRLLRTKRDAIKEAEYIFGKRNWFRIFEGLLRRISLRTSKYDGQKGYVLYQKLIQGNNRDYRITTIGENIAFAFYRNNRPNDFRASGSGLIDYSAEHDIEAIKYCLDVSRRLSFDSMCYDVVYDKEGFYIIEFSYTYVDSAIYNAPGYFYLDGNNLDFVKGHYWPQKLLLDFLLNKWGIF